MTARSSGPSAAIVLESTSEEHTIEIARTLAGHLEAGDVVTLAGPLGAGKTRFVRGLAAGLGLDPDAVTSPTFVLCHEYAHPEADQKRAGGPRLAHLDAYRLTSEEDLESIGWQELLESPDVVIAVEWPARLGDELPDRRIDVTIDHIDEHRRRITVIPHARPGLLGIEPELPCRMCGAPVAPGAETSPFCSSRCRMADLGAWFGEGYRVSRAMRDDDELDELME